MKTAEMAREEAQPAPAPDDALAHAGSTTRRGLTLLLALAIVVAGLLVYLNSINGAFLFDDEEHIILNPHVKTFSKQTMTYRRRPVVNLTFYANYQLSTFDTWSYHALNIAIHLAAGLVLFGIVRRTILLLPGKYQMARAAPWLAFTVALIWVVHPLQTQSVNYLVQRGESLMGLFYLLTLYCVIRGALAERAWPWYATALVACALGMGSKAVMATAPLLVLLYDRVFLADSFRSLFRRRWGLYAGLFAMYAILGVLGIFVVFKPGTEGSNVGFATEGLTWWQYFRTQPEVIMHYLRLSVWPAELCLDYRWPVQASAAAVVFAGVFVTGLFVATILALKQWPPLGYAGAWFFVILGPTSSIIPIRDLAVEHRMYLPLAAVVVVAVVACYLLLRKAWARWSVPESTARWVTTGLVVVVAAGLSARTIARNGDYDSEIEMWTSVVEAVPDNGRAHQNLGRAFILKGRTQEALPHLVRAVEINPYHSKAHVNIGNIMLMDGQLEKAVIHYTAAAEINPEMSDPHTNLGALYLTLNSNARDPDKKSEYLDKAEDHLRQAVRIDRRDADARRNLGLTLVRKDEVVEAIKWYREAVSINPNFADAYFSLGAALERQGLVDEAIAEYEKAVKIKPDHPRAGPALERLLE